MLIRSEFDEFKKLCNLVDELPINEIRLLVFTSLIEGILQNINFSIISGEYVEEDISSLLNDFDKSIKQEIDKQAKIQCTEKEQILDCINQLNLALEYYCKLDKIAKNHLNNIYLGDTKFYFIDETSRLFSRNEIREVSEIIKNPKNAKHNNHLLLSLLKANVLLAELDSSIECSEKFLRTLLNIYHSFLIRENYEKKEGDTAVALSIYEILKEKCEFLIYKVMCRLDVDSIIDDEFKNLKKESLKKDDLKSSPEYFVSLFDKTDLVYSKDYKDPYYIKEELKKISELDLLDDTHSIHKHGKILYKSNISVNQSLEKLDYLILKTRDKIINSDNSSQLEDFNSYAFTNVVFLLMKNKLKVISNDIDKIIEDIDIEVSDSTITKIKENIEKLNLYYRDIKSLIENINTTHKYKLNDYYHTLIYAEVIYKLSQFCLLKSVYKKDLVTIAKELLKETGIKYDNKFNKSINNEGLIYEIEKNYQICKAINYLPVYSTFKECLVSIGSKYEHYPIQNIFLDSSYVLPINYSAQRKKINDLKSDYYYINSLLSRVDYFNREMEETKRVLQKEIKEKFDEKFDQVEKQLDGKVRDSNIGGLQILGTFTSVLAIIVVFTNIIPKSENILLGIIYMLAFSLSLGVFLLTLNYIINYKQENQVFKSKFWNSIFPSKLYLYFAGLLILIGISLLFYKPDAKTDMSSPTKNVNEFVRKIEIKNKKDTIQSYIDSTVINIDSFKTNKQ